MENNFIDFKTKRIEYYNNWPDSEPFEMEKLYSFAVNELKKPEGKIFCPFKLVSNNDEVFNRSLSFLIEALGLIEKIPSLSYESVFKAFDCFGELYYSNTNNSNTNNSKNNNITDKLKKLSDNEWKRIIDGNNELKNAFNELFSVIPVKACQYLYKRISDHSDDNQPYKRLTTGYSGGVNNDSSKRKKIIDLIENKYGYDYNNYPESIRKASMTYRYLLKNTSIDLEQQDNGTINKETFNISIEDKINFLTLGLLYTLRNDNMHGSSIALGESSKSSLGTYAISFFAFLLLYYLVILLIIDKYRSDYSSDIEVELASNIKTNIEKYKKLFGSSIKR